MTEAVATALQHVGCPADTAEEVATRTRIERRSGAWMLLLHGHGSAIDLPIGPDEWTGAAEHVARNLAADNAEALGRTARGEPGWTAYWPPA